MNVDILFSVETVHKETGKRHFFSVKASDVKHAVDSIFHPHGFTLENGTKGVFKLNRDNYHILKVVQREG